MIQISKRPDWLYKFCSIDGADGNLLSSMRESYLWYSKPSDFNDPFDCNPELLIVQTPPYANRIDTLSSLPTADKIKYKENPTELLQMLSNAKRDVLHSQGVCCFSMSYTNNLMWSHYAKSHKGLCLVWDHRILSKNHTFCPVHYTNDFTPIDLFVDPEEALLNVLVTKSAEWSYEEEYRALGFKQGKVPFIKEALIGIIFGCKASDLDIDLVMTTCKEVGYSDLEWHKAVMLKDGFGLDFVSI